MFAQPRFTLTLRRIAVTTAAAAAMTASAAAESAVVPQELPARVNSALILVGPVFWGRSLDLPS